MTDHSEGSPESSEHIVPRDITLPNPSAVAGRGDNRGEWLEHELQQALRRWGYTTARRVEVYGMEMDVVGHRTHPHNRPSDWIVAECKDWTADRIPPRVLHRLCMLALTCQAMPILCHTSELTPRAARIARRWEVRVLTYPDLQRGTIPGPQVVDFRGRAYDPSVTPAGIRELRGRMPPMFTGHPVPELSYVSGYQPTGEYGLYEPVTISRTTENE